MTGQRRDDGAAKGQATGTGGTTSPASGKDPLPPARSWPPPPRRSGDGSRQPAKGPGGGFRLPPWTWWLVFGLLTLWNLALFVPLGTPSVELPYSEFLVQAKAGNVAQVQFKGQGISGTLKQPIAWPAPSAEVSKPASASAEAGSSAPPGSAATGSAAPAASGSGQGSGTYSDFTTVVPPNGDPALLPLLEAQGVTITAQDSTSGGSVLLNLALAFLPTLLLVGYLVYMGRQLQRSQQGMFGFGGSRARVYDAERPTVTFDDVAGADDAKVELQEVVEFLREPERYRRLGA
ncbi:MAG TPA: ATP-dependent metallopeptidase FtsH/Yme1/Tma family protein, partial [Candidatus Dormibacteraeota bacterium]|nr:ATP-dependent metallopeptidase FtsH/Yme1/Tma family protein [Candidatus Dormibacteraeota bacterium]